MVENSYINPAPDIIPSISWSNEPKKWDGKCVNLHGITPAKVSKALCTLVVVERLLNYITVNKTVKEVFLLAHGSGFDKSRYFYYYNILLYFFIIYKFIFSDLEE